MNKDNNDVNSLPDRIVLSLGEIKRIGIFEVFCVSEFFNKEGVISRTNDDCMFSLKSKLLPKNYKYNVPEGWFIKDYNGN